MCYNPFILTGQHILVTGASSGIGRAVAIECSRLGARLIITGRNEERLNETYLLLDQNQEHIMLTADLTLMQDLSGLVSSLPQLNGLVHCAAIIKKVPLKFITQEAMEEIIHVNLTTPAILVQKIVRSNKIASKGSIVLVSSIASSVASFGNIMYMASKGGLNSLARGMALELAAKGIRVNCIEPALIKTNLANVLSEDDLQNYIKKFPLERFGLPEEVAYGAVYLLSKATEWVTGTVVKIDGGVTLR